MGRRWPESGTWVVVPTSPTADWALVAAVLAAATPARVAVIATGVTAPPPERLLAHVASWAELHDGGTQPLRLADALRIVDAFSGTHDLVLVAGAAGLTAPTGRNGWTTADLAAALGAPAVVVVGDDPRGVNYTTVEALEARGLASALVTVGTAPERLPAEPDGRIPADVPELDAVIARGFLDPKLRAGSGLTRIGPETPAEPATAPAAWPARGQWTVAPVPATAGWEPAVTALAAASTARVAVVAIGVTGPPAPRPAAHLATWVAVRDGARQPLRRQDAVRVSDALARTHEVVLIVGADERAGWSLADLAATLGAPVVLVAGAQTTGDRLAAARGEIEERGLTSAVIAVGDVALAGPFAGRVPDDAGELTAETARELLDPILHATRAAVPPPPSARRRPRPPARRRPAAPPRSRAGGARIVLLLVAVFAIMSLSVVGLAFCNRTVVAPTGPAPTADLRDVP
ncbi:dethiobiotin synthetase [Catenuloplanes nepalensis]|uniref:Dethiobiotin synthetase n=1 Tax=Catenuloplanes nepalensis TaxID=587533 RepID=A0ABT9MN34_9ACTN|nr:hypothetical protein [Catenuloplanes nepalensis]MDP9792805.1 dethiobiotin synthetase [Catenuloplanes nepalensis]